jgi:alanine-glyoxylate transaminase/serine-glyoxylate transaminase/serine-pyruvate transaminase
VLLALASPTIGHLDPEFLALMDQVRAMLGAVLGTSSTLALPISGTGSSGMETCLVNLVEPGDSVLVGVNGVFGGRLAEIARRAGAQVTVAQGEWGRALDPAVLRAAANGKKQRLVCVVHGETSTGVLQDLPAMRAVADELGALLLVDAVTTLGGLPIDMDAQRIDALYSGTQKCLSCPPGLSPVAFSAEAQRVLASRKVPVQSWYLDLSLIGQYWGSERVYHHTAPINMLYAIHEGLRLVLEEGLDVRAARHRENARALGAGLEALGLTLRVPPGERLPPLTTVAIPDGVDDLGVRRALLARYGIEIGGGLGPMKGNTWRIGLMGAGSTRRNVTLVLAALETLLREQGFATKGDPLAAAAAEFSKTPR